MAGCGDGPVVGSHAAVETAAVFPGALHDGPRIPAGFPVSFDSPMAWSGSHFAKPSDYTIQLDELDVSEVESALQHFKGNSQSPASSRRSTLSQRWVSTAISCQGKTSPCRGWSPG